MKPPALGDQSAASCHGALPSPARAGPPAAVTWILGVSEGGLAASKTVHAHPQVDIPVGIPADHAW
jgi:hypothetical protein